MQLDWITDPHLDHISEKDLLGFLDCLHKRPSDALLVTGDIAESRSIYEFLGLLSGAYQRPIYFVLGNHDFYGAPIPATKQKVRSVCANVPPGILNWLTESPVIHLNPHTVIVGHDGFYDGQLGDGRKTTLSMMDFNTRHGIPELYQALTTRGNDRLFDLIRAMGQECTDFLEAQIDLALTPDIKRILILTHVPPFHESSLFRGKISDSQSVPFYVNKSLGDMLRRKSAQHPDVQFRVHAGHTHGPCYYQAEVNLSVQVGSARYEKPPQFQTPIEIV